VQLDQNIFAKDSLEQKTETAPNFTGANGLPIGAVEQLAARTYDGRVNITSVRDARGKASENSAQRNDDAR
jgi:hypothetical protein